LNGCQFPCELIARENRGLSATLNEGFKLTRGRYFAYIGADDQWMPTFLEARVRLLSDRPHAALAYGNAYSIDADDHIIDCTTDWARYRDGDVREMLLQTLAPLSPSVVYRRDALEGHRWNESSRLEDYEMYLRLSSEGEFAFDAAILAGWRQHTYNVSGDLTMMLKEKLAAFASTEHLFGLSEKESAQVRSLIRFRMAQDMMRQGRRSEAAKIGLTNLTGVGSGKEIIKFLAGSVLPHSVMATKRDMARQRAFERYGMFGSTN
jgi:glycosyltransferase involved in cell wall biosynthesis